MKGRKPIPTAIKAAKGTLKASRVNEAEPKYSLIKSLPDPPKELTGIGRDIYYSVGSELADKGILTSVSFALFIQYCLASSMANEAYGRFLEAPTVLTARGITTSPHFRIWQNALIASLRIGVEFGLTPVSKAKVIISETKKSMLDDFLK